MSVSDYELLNILDKNTNSKIFKVRHKTTGEHFVWYTIDTENLSNPQLINLEERFGVRKETQHPNLLEFHDVIKGEDSCLYFVVKYCKHGSLKDLMDMVFNDNKRFSEEFLCKILYQIAFTVKTADLVTNFNINDIYFDKDYNVQFFNFIINANETKLKNLKISSLGTLMFEVCTLTKFGKKYFEKELKNCNLYSKEFLSLLTAMIKDSRDLKKNIDKVMCNSTVLHKITQWSKHKCFLKIDDGKCVQNNEKVEDIYALQIEKLREKEVILQKKETMLKEWEKTLAIKEKKIASMEKQLRGSVKQAEITRNTFTKTCSCSSRNSPTVDQKEPIKELLDSTYISCGDSVIIPTSRKLNVKEIIKPATFTRTLSEKRIRFKGHSPLKDIDFNRRRSMRHVKKQKAIYGKNEWITCSDDTDKSTLAHRKKATNKKCKQLFHTDENNSNPTVSEDVAKPLQWTQENKKYAFELLRLMNKDKENNHSDVKHTYL